VNRSTKTRNYRKGRVKLRGRDENKEDRVGSERSSDSKESAKKCQKRVSDGWTMSRMNRLNGGDCWW
jgi:hypothetical protein